MNNQVNIDLDKCDDVVCSAKDCENGLFISAFMLKRVPALMIAQPQDKIVNVNKMVCTVCGAVYDPKDAPQKETVKLIKT